MRGRGKEIRKYISDELIMLGIIFGVVVIIMGVVGVGREKTLINTLYDWPWTTILGAAGLLFVIFFAFRIVRQSVLLLSSPALADFQGEPLAEESAKEGEDDWLLRTWKFLWSIPKLFLQMARAVVFLFIKTPYLLLPSVAHTSLEDDRYNDEIEKTLKEAIYSDDVKLTPGQKDIIVKNWIDQICWTNKRATRERDANELMRWWQIVLGVLIPVVARLVEEENVALGIVTVLGILVAIITGIYQLRRPEDRWRHYRTVHERYLTELWNYITLSGRYKGRTHRNAFVGFNGSMSHIRRDEVVQFFGHVVPPPDQRLPEEKEDADKEIDDQSGEPASDSEGGTGDSTVQAASVTGTAAI